MPKLPLWAYIVGGILVIGILNYFSLIAGDRIVAVLRGIRG